MQHRLKLQTALGALSLTACVGMAGAAMAQTATGTTATGITGVQPAQAGTPATNAASSSVSTESNTPFETVIVTARKRAENEQTVPISITALTQTDLDNLSVKTIEDLKYVSPSVYIAPTTFRQDTLNVTIRGQRNFDSPSGGGNPGLGFDTAAAIYKDGVYYARAVGLTGSLFDVDNVEVLKGPQGTLVGRNSTGGAVLYTTREPGPDFGGYVKGTAGDYGRGAIQGAVNIPITDTLAVRVALNVDDQKGYIANYYTDPASGYSNHQPGFGSDKVAGVISAKWTPDSTFSLLLRADISAEHDTGSTYHDLGYFVGTLASSGRTSVCNLPGTCALYTDLLGHAIGPQYLTVSATGITNASTAPAAYNALLNSIAREQTYGFWSTEQTVSNADVGHYQTYSGVANKTFDNIDVKLLGAYRHWDNFGQAASRGLPYDGNVYIYQYPNYQSYQSELTVNGTALDDKLKWTTGLFFFRETSPNDGGYLFQFLPSGGTPTAASGKQITITDSSQNGEANTSYAGYAQGTYTILEGTRLTAGGRYTYDERYALIDTQTVRTPSTAALTNTFVNAVYNATPQVYNGISYAGQSDSCALTNANGVILPEASCPSQVNKSFHKPTWTLAVDHDLFDGTLVYATMRSGYRSGAINTGAINPLVTVAKPEELLDYEVGVKSDFDVFGMPVRANLAGYQSAYHNIQIQQTLPNITIATAPGGVCTQALYNAGSCLATTNDNVTLNAAKSRIYGLEWDFRIKPIEALTLAWSGSYLDARYTDYTYVPPPGYLYPTTSTNLSGSPIPLPRWQTNGTATYSFGGFDMGGLSFDDAAFIAHYYFQSRYLANFTGYNPAQQTGAYGLLNFRFALTNVGGTHADFAAFMNNVVNTPACLPEYNGVLNSAPNGTFGTANASGALQCIPLAPRMTGIELAYKF